MAILFDFYESPPQEGEDNKLRVYARPVFSQTIETEQLAAIIHGRTSLGKGDIYSTLVSLGEVLAERLADGQRVYMDGIGYFSVTLGCAEIRTKKDMNASSVGVKAVEFRADKRLKDHLKNARVRRMPVNGHSARLSDAEVDSRVAGFLEENLVMTRRGFQYLCQMKQGMAFRHIHRLLEEGKIRNAGTKRQPIYVAVKKE